MIRNIKEPLLKEVTLDAINRLVESHELADKQIKANIMKIVKNSKVQQSMSWINGWKKLS